jgi:hypothetical protein
MEDELIGQWHTDNSGGIHLLYGSAIRFDNNGKGFMNVWGGSGDPDDLEDPKYDYEFEIEWTRVDAVTIKIRREYNTEWTFLNYKLSTIIGEYSIQYDKIVSIGNNPTGEIIKEWFWDIPEPLYRKQ